MEGGVTLRDQASRTIIVGRRCRGGGVVCFVCSLGGRVGGRARLVGAAVEEKGAGQTGNCCCCCGRKGGRADR